MKNTGYRELCRFCEKEEIYNIYKLHNRSEVTDLLPPTITKEYLLVPACENCYRELDRTKIYGMMNGVLALICLGVDYLIYSSIEFYLRRNQSIIYDLVGLIFISILFITFAYFSIKNLIKFNTLVLKFKAAAIGINQKSEEKE